MYLNQFDFVNNAVGINSAATVYFNTTPDSLTIEQSATLVGMLKNSSYFNPFSGQRRHGSGGTLYCRRWSNTGTSQSRWPTLS
jgi:penicillin-binding protein 1A